ncbi:MAG: diguanylate cyclase [Clostridia bacterium]|nr:diguanylate cyclase [Clostridia bacterium]
MKKVLILILTALCLNSIAFADTFFDDGTMPMFERINREDGLQDFSVSNIVQDKNGYIWFATQGGLFKYNGESTIAYRNDPFDTEGLIHNLIQTMYYDDECHQLWLGTYQGISVLDIGSNKFTSYTVDDNNLSNSVVTAIERDRTGNLWFGTLDGLNRLDSKTNQFVNYSVPGDVVRSLLLDSRGRLLIGTYEGFYIYNEDADGLDKVLIDYPTSYVMVIKEFTEGVLTVGFWDGGVLEMDLDFNILNHHQYRDNRVYTLCRTTDGTLWTGTWGGGLYAEKDGLVHEFPGTGENGDIEHGVVYSLMEDRSGILWIGTNGGGAYKANPGRGNYLLFSNDPDDPDSLESGKVNTIYRDQSGRLWIAVYNKGLSRYDSEKDVLIKYSTMDNTHVLPDNQIMDFIETDGRLFIATGKGVAEYDVSADSFVMMDILPEMITYALEVDGDDGLWVGTYVNGVYYFDDKLNLVRHFEIANMNYPLSDNLVYDIHSDSKGQVWIATNHGLNRYDKETDQLKTYYKEAGNYKALASDNIRRLFEDSKGQMWVGMSGGGLARYNAAEDNFDSFTETDGLINNSVISIHEAKNGLIWAATHGGVSLIDPETDVIANISTAEDAGDENYTGDGWTDVDGSIYLGGINGVTRFPPGQVTKTTQVPPIYINEVLLYHTSIDPSVEIFNGMIYELEPYQNYISFSFEALDYDKKAQIQYYYQLSDVDSDWVNSGKRQFASYSNLESGNYVFRVMAKTFDGVVTEPVEVRFSIKEHWYQTAPAYAFYVLMGVVLILLIIKIHEGKLIAERNSELATLNSKLKEAVEELEKVSIKDPLTGIYNRRYFDTVLKDHMELAKRSENFLSLLMLDIDNFKMINDKYGHVAGDQFLVTFAEALQKQLLRHTDFVARFGGDEFAIVLYDTDPSGTRILADRILKSIREIQNTTGIDLKGIETSVSIGVCCMIPSMDATSADFIDLADKSMYEAKTSGKNRAVFGS